MSGKSDENQIELLDAGNYADYLLRDPLEIAAVLHGLVQRRTMVSAHPEGSRAFALTSVLAADAKAGTLLFDSSGDDAANRRLVGADSVTFSALLDKIRVQFSTGPLSATEHEGYPAFAAPLPRELLRLQRREYFRLITPVAHSVTCQIPVPIDADRLKTFEARVLDISGGGVGVLVPPRGLDLATDMEFDGCSLLLPEFGDITAQLRIRSVFRITNRNGIVMTRAGCQFVDLPTGAETLIQRYILKIERERGARAKRV